jgi:hypothetical protein
MTKAQEKCSGARLHRVWSHGSAFLEAMQRIKEAILFLKVRRKA